jgi:uncharacterized protein YbjT (DUF2867 family)
MNKIEVLVTGATGKQGGAVARRLITNGHRVRAITRKPSGPAAGALAALGVEIVEGDLEDRASLDRALHGVDAVFSMTTPFETGTATETRQGITVADAAKAAGAHLVYTSVANADLRTGIPHFDSKLAVEEHIREIGLDATIIAPAYFMENLGFVRNQLEQGAYPSPLTRDRKLAQIAVADIAAVAASVVENRARHLGRRYDLAGDELSAEESIAILSKVTGKKLSYVQTPMEMVRAAMGEDGKLMYQWFEDHGYRVDLAEVRRTFPDVEWHSFEAWARDFQADGQSR